MLLKDTSGSVLVEGIGGDTQGSILYEEGSGRSDNEGSGLLRVSGMLCESKCEVASLVLAASSEGRRKSGDKIWEGKRGKYCL